LRFASTVGVAGLPMSASTPACASPASPTMGNGQKQTRQVTYRVGLTTSAVFKLVRSAGHDPNVLARTVGLDDEARALKVTQIELGTCRRLWERAAELCADELFGITVAKAIGRGAFGALEYSARTASSLGQAADLLLAHCSFLSSNDCYELQIHDDEARLVYRVPGEPLGLGRHANEFFAAYIALIGGELHIPPSTTIWFAHPHHAAAKRVEAFFHPATVRWGNGFSGATFSRALLELPLPSADPRLSELIRRTLLVSYQAGSSISARVRGLLRQLLPQGGVTMNGVATQLLMSERTLQRQLAVEGTSFSDIVDQFRREHALEALGKDGVSLSALSCELGFSDPRAFFRAFRRWTGMTPNQFRAQQSVS